MTVDPVIALSLRLALALLFGVAAAHKLRDSQRFEATMRAYRLLHPAIAIPFAKLLPGLEIALALGLLLASTHEAAAAAAALVLTLYSLAIGINLHRGRRSIDCGCFGTSARVPLSGGLLARNLGLITAALASMLPVRPRALVWVDGMTVLTAVVGLALLWAAAQRLAQTEPRLRRIGGR